MPDLEAIRENCINQTEKPKPKVYQFKPTKLLAVAAVAVAAVTSVVAFAASNAGWFEPKATEPTIVETEAQIPTVPATEKNNKKGKADKADNAQTSSSSGADSAYNQSDKKILTTTGAERCIARMENAGYEPTWLKDLGKVEGYHLCYAGTDEASSYDCRYIIGGYTFDSSVQYHPYGLGLYVVGHEQTYTLEQAYSDGIVNLSVFVDLIYSYDEEDLNFTVSENDETSENFLSYFGNPDAVTLADLGSADDYELFYRIPSAPSGITDSDIVLGDYTISVENAQEIYSPGLYVECNDTISTLSEAVENGIVKDMDDIAELILGSPNDNISFCFSLNKTQAAAEATVPPSETEQEAVA